MKERESPSVSEEEQGEGEEEEEDGGGGSGRGEREREEEEQEDGEDGGSGRGGEGHSQLTPLEGWGDGESSGPAAAPSRPSSSKTPTSTSGSRTPSKKRGAPRKRTPASQPKSKLVMKTVRIPYPVEEPLTGATKKLIMEALKTVAEHPLSSEFLLPVTSLYPEVTEQYQAIIKRPIDLGTIWRRLKRGYYHYKGAGKVHRDLTRMFNNCKAFVGANSDFENVAKHLQALVENLWGETKLLLGAGESKAEAATRRYKLRHERYALCWGYQITTGRVRGSIERAVRTHVNNKGLAGLGITGDAPTLGSIVVAAWEAREEKDGDSLLKVDSKDPLPMIEKIFRCPSEEADGGSWVAFDNALSKITVSLAESIARGSNVSSVWSRPESIVWGNRHKGAYWPGLLLWSRHTPKALKVLNEKRLPSGILSQLNKQPSARNPNYALVEYLGIHDFAWVKLDGIVPLTRVEDNPNSKPVKKKAYDEALEEAERALREHPNVADDEIAAGAIQTMEMGGAEEESDSDESLQEIEVAERPKQAKAGVSTSGGKASKKASSISMIPPSPSLKRLQGACDTSPKASGPHAQSHGDTAGGGGGEEVSSSKSAMASAIKPAGGDGSCSSSKPKKKKRPKASEGGGSGGEGLHDHSQASSKVTPANSKAKSRSGSLSGGGGGLSKKSAGGGQSRAASADSRKARSIKTVRKYLAKHRKAPSPPSGAMSSLTYVQQMRAVLIQGGCAPRGQVPHERETEESWIKFLKDEPDTASGDDTDNENAALCMVDSEKPYSCALRKDALQQQLNLLHRHIEVLERRLVEQDKALGANADTARKILASMVAQLRDEMQGAPSVRPFPPSPKRGRDSPSSPSRNPGRQKKRSRGRRAAAVEPPSPPRRASPSYHDDNDDDDMHRGAYVNMRYGVMGAHGMHGYLESPHGSYGGPLGMMPVGHHDKYGGYHQQYHHPTTASEHRRHHQGWMK